MRLIATLKPETYLHPVHSYGVVAEIDWERKAVVRTLKIPAASFQDSAAFMACLLGGVDRWGDKLVVAAWNFIAIIDYDTFTLEDAVSWPPMADLHGLAVHGDQLWVASTAIDAVLCLDLATRELRWRWGPDEPILYRDRVATGWWARARRRLRLPGRPPAPDPRRFPEGEYRAMHKSRSSYHHHHLNDVCWHDGTLYVTTKGWNDNVRGAVIGLDPATRGSAFFVPPGGFTGAHDGLFVDGTFYATESGRNAVAWRRPDGSLRSRPVGPSPRYVRGLLHTGSSFIVGFSPPRGVGGPAELVEYDPDFTRPIGRMRIEGMYPTEQGTAVHALCAAPR